MPPPFGDIIGKPLANAVLLETVHVVIVKIAIEYSPAPFIAKLNDIVQADIVTVPDRKKSPPPPE